MVLEGQMSKSKKGLGFEGLRVWFGRFEGLRV